jgi:nicotinate-nucleotide adenylyltransferase
VEVALLGGSFNPPHVGHLLAAVFVRATEGADEVWLMPTYQHPFGKAAVEFEHRLEMCEAMAREIGPWLKSTDVERAVGGAGRTIDTLTFLSARYPEHRFSLVIGSDILKDLPSWKEFDRIRQLARAVIINRAGHPSAEAVGPPLAEVSSTQIRAMFEAGIEPVSLVPRAVLRYAREQGLYGL